MADMHEADLLKPASQKARMCRERAVAARKLAESAPTLAERDARRAAEQQWLRFARLYEMDEIIASLGPTETEQQQDEESQARAL